MPRLASSVRPPAASGGGAPTSGAAKSSVNESKVSRESGNEAKPPTVSKDVEGSADEKPSVPTTAGEAISAGLLNTKANKRVVPAYPPTAKSSGATGVVRVYVTVNETGKVAGVFRSEGPLLLRAAAEQAARRWKFEPTE